MWRLSSLSKFIQRLSFSTTMPSYEAVTHVIFDLDGTILDTEGMYNDTYSSVIESFGQKYESDVRLAVLGTKEQDTCKIIVDRLNLPVSPEEFARITKELQKKVMGSVKCKPGAERLIRHLHSNNIPLALATSSGEPSFRLKITEHESLFKGFSHFVCGSTDPEVVNGKPAPDIFLITAERFPDSPDPRKCLVFEDAPNGVTGAVSAGMQVVMIPEDFLPQERIVSSKPTQVIGSLLHFKPEQFGLPPFPITESP